MSTFDCTAGGKKYATFVIGKLPRRQQTALYIVVDGKVENLAYFVSEKAASKFNDILRGVTG